jgi:hypothetical protein
VRTREERPPFHSTKPALLSDDEYQELGFSYTVKENEGKVIANLLMETIDVRIRFRGRFILVLLPFSCLRVLNES